MSKCRRIVCRALSSLSFARRL